MNTYETGRPAAARRFLPTYHSLESGDDLEQVADQAHIRHFEDRRFAVLVDGDDGASVLDAGQMLDRTRNADRDVDFRRNDLARLSHLHLIGRIARIDRGA